MRVILCVCVSVWEREHCIWYSVHFRLLNLSNNCKVLGQLSSAFSFSCSLVSFRFVSLFIYSFCLPQSHVSRLLLLAVFVVSNAAWKASSFWGPKCDKIRNKQTSDEIEFIANGFNAVFRAINKYETENKITHDTVSAANLAIFPSSLAFFQCSIAGQNRKYCS